MFCLAEVDVDGSPVSSWIPNWWNVSEIELCESWNLLLVLRDVNGLEVEIDSSSIKLAIDLFLLLREDVLEVWLDDNSS